MVHPCCNVSTKITFICYYTQTYLWLEHNRATSCCVEKCCDSVNWPAHDGMTIPDSEVHGANIGPIWGRQDAGGPHVGPMNFAIWDVFSKCWIRKESKTLTDIMQYFLKNHGVWTNSRNIYDRDTYSHHIIWNVITYMFIRCLRN